MGMIKWIQKNGKYLIEKTPSTIENVFHFEYKLVNSLYQGDMPEIVN